MANPSREIRKRPSESTELISNKRQKLPLSIYRTQVLSEDDYTDALARIIRRDFFPDLHAKCLAEEKEARRRERMAQADSSATFAGIDQSRMDWATARSRLKETPVHFARTPAETPRRQTYAETLEEPKSYDESLSLTSFLSKYTSEDNASFAEILQRQNTARREKYSWMYEAENKANAIEDRNREVRHKLIESIQRAVEQSENGEVMLIEGLEPGRPAERLILEPGLTHLVGDRETVANAKQRLITAANESIASGAHLIEGGKRVLMIDDGKSKSAKSAEQETSADDPIPRDAVQESVAERLPGRDVGLVEAWKYTSRNAFMFPPDANVSLTAPAPKRKPDEEDRLGMNAPKGINYASTRILVPSTSRLDVPPSPTRSNIAAAISGTPYPGRGEPVTPRVNGYGFVDRMAQPDSGPIGQAGLKQLMTYGTLLATPVALRQLSEDAKEDENDPMVIARRRKEAETVEGPFKIPATPRREVIAHRMAKTASKSLSARHGVNVPTLDGALANHPLARLATPRSSMLSSTPRKDGDMLTPAARTLLDRTGASARKSASLSVKSSANDDDARKARQREKIVQERLRRATWDETPV